MFNKNSRYHGLETVTAEDARGRAVQAVKLRRLPSTAGVDQAVTSSSQLDVMSHELYQDATRFWRIADANTELQANALVEAVGRVIEVPKR